MGTLEAAARAFAKAYPTPAHHPNGGAKTWDQWCGAAMWRFCEAYGTAPTGDVRSAYIVYERSKIVSKDASKALPGDFHFWDIAGRANGHVMVDIFGGGRTVFGGTRSAKSIEGATALGFMSVRRYTLAKFGRARYLGFSRRYANGDVTDFTLPTATAAGTLTPVPAAPVAPAPERRNPVALGFSTTNYGKQSFAVLTDGVWTAIPTKALADAISTHPNVGRFTVLAVKDFYEMRDSAAKAVPPLAVVTPAAPSVLKLDAAAIKAVATAVRLDLKAAL